MRRPFVLITAIVAVVGLGAAVAAAKDTSRVKTSVTLGYLLTGHRGDKPISYLGEVKAKKKGCETARTVIVYGEGGRIAIGSDKSNDRGNYRVFSYQHTRPFFAVAQKRTITMQNGDRVVCKAGKSNILTPTGSVRP